MYISSRLGPYETKLKYHIIIIFHRNTGSGLASMSGRFGGILYPYILYLSKLDIGPISKRKFEISLFCACHEYFAEIHESFNGKDVAKMAGVDHVFIKIN